MDLVRISIAIGLFGACVFFGPILEADPVTHILVQLPLLAISGGLLVAGLGGQNIPISDSWANAISWVAVFTILIWMLPRSIDAALSDPVVELAKFVSIPIFVGGSFALGWGKSHPFLRGFLKANAISMLGVLSFLYVNAPVRICNSYLVADQERLGYAFLFAAFGLSIAWAIPLFVPPQEKVQISKTSMSKDLA